MELNLPQLALTVIRAQNIRYHKSSIPVHKLYVKVTVDGKTERTESENENSLHWNQTLTFPIAKGKDLSDLKFHIELVHASPWHKTVIGTLAITASDLWRMCENGQFVSLDLEDKRDSLIKATLDVILVKQNIIHSVEGVPRAITGTDKTPSVIRNRIKTSLAFQIVILLGQVLS